MVAPLDWGLGHATRDISIIRALISNGFEVIVAAEGAQASLLATEFPQILILPLRGYRVRYSKYKWSFLPTLLMQMPGIYNTIWYERRWLRKTIEAQQIDLVISDNRFGLHSKKIPCIFITHQLSIKAPFSWLEKRMRNVNYHFINQFTACWVPDMANNPNIAGLLSHPTKLPAIPTQYIGLLSRFSQEATTLQYNYCILLSGPEPQRTLLEKKIVAGLASIKGKVLLVRGKPGSEETIRVPSNTMVVNHLPGKAMQEAILQSDYIVCRGGYTSLMELLLLRKKLLLVPTPGQTEQEYLAEKLMQENICLSVSQNKLNCVNDFERMKAFDYRIPAFIAFKNSDIHKILTGLSN